MKQILPSNQVNKAAQLALDNLVEPDMYEYQMLQAGMKSLELDVKHYKTAFLLEWDELSPFAQIVTSRKTFACKIMSERYLFLFDDKKSCGAYIDLLFTKSHDSLCESIGAKFQMINMRSKVNFVNSSVAVEKHTELKKKLTALTNTNGQVVLDEDEIKLIGEWL